VATLTSAAGFKVQTSDLRYFKVASKEATTSSRTAEVESNRSSGISASSKTPEVAEDTKQSKVAGRINRDRRIEETKTTRTKVA